MQMKAWAQKRPFQKSMGLRISARKATKRRAPA
jgi:hypothetical protein